VGSFSALDSEMDSSLLRKIMQMRARIAVKEQKHVMIIAGEPSGDLHGANLIRELISIDPALIITGIGGDLMEQQGMKLFFHIRDLSAMGVTEVIMQFKRIKQAFDLFRRKIAQNRPDLLILIDYPGFNLRAAACAKLSSIPVLYYITPKVWAWNSSRLNRIKQYVDHAALIFPFEEAIFRKESIPATFVGHPLLDCHRHEHIPEKSEGQSMLPKVIGLLPGSRESEISKLLELMLKSARLVHEKYEKVDHSLCHRNRDHLQKNPDLVSQKSERVTFLVSAASSINIERFNRILDPYNHDGIFEVVRGEPSALFRRSDLLIAASGTVTLEAAISGVPMVIVYKTSLITYFLAKIFVRIPHVGLPNIIAGYPIVPELLQDDATPERVSDKILSIMPPDTLLSMKKQLLMIPRYLGGAGASRRTAHIAIQMIQD